MAKDLDNIFNISAAVFGTNPLRGRSTVRALMRKDLVPSRLIAAILVVDEPRQTSKLPMVAESDLATTAKLIASLGIRAVKVFVESKVKTLDGLESINPNSLGIRAISRIKESAPELCIISDTCLCSYTTDGRCVLTNSDASIDKERTIATLLQQSDAQLKAGADIIGAAPMIDGAVKSLKLQLGHLGLDNIPIMPHLTWRSSLYRLFRSEMSTGSGYQREGFQIDPSCPDQFLAMARAMAVEGADILQLQPGLFSMDAVRDLRMQLPLPIALYSVSGEYHMMRSLSSNEETFFEILYEHAVASFRSGADYLVTYAWKELASGIRRLENA